MELVWPVVWVRTTSSPSAEREKLVWYFSVVKFFHGQYPPVDGRDRIDQRNLVAFNGFQNVFGAWPVFEDHAGHAVAQRKHDVMTKGADEAPLARGIGPVAGLGRQPIAI